MDKKYHLQDVKLHTELPIPIASYSPKPKFSLLIAKKRVDQD